MNKHYYVYTHINKANWKVYVGITTQKPEYRWNDGKGYLKRIRNNKYGQPKFANAILKYGWNGFVHNYFEVQSEEEMKYWETYLIDYYDSINNGYNITSGGDCPKLSNESRQKMSLSHLGKHLSDDTKQKISNTKKGNSKAVLQFSIDNLLIKEWDSAIEAETTLQINSRNIRKCCSGKRQTAGGFIWKYKK